MTAPQSVSDSSIHPHRVLKFTTAPIDLAYLRSAVEEAGAGWVGVQEGRRECLVLFNDPVSHNTIAIREADVTPAAVRAKIQESRERLSRAHS
jgi:hypothetical protein